MGEISPERPTLVRVHLQSTLCDLFGAYHPACGWPLKDVMAQISAAGEGVIVVLRNRDDSEDLLGKVRELCDRNREDEAPPLKSIATSCAPTASARRSWPIRACARCG
jgi:3,4-dihydroxy 2-butanone 4-phosphate synthase/GTP cyclohydrolase II